MSAAPDTPAEPGGVRVRRALLTVSDKRGLVDFARGLQELGVETSTDELMHVPYDIVLSECLKARLAR